MRKGVFKLGMAGIFFLFYTTIISYAQEVSLPPVSDVYAITGATIIPAPGLRIEKGTIIIRKGIIDHVGKTISLPKDAIEIKADSLYVYAAFIDGLSRVAVHKTNCTGPQESVTDPGNPPPAVAGITPQLEVRDMLDQESHLIEELRGTGFALSHVVPYGVFLPGKSSLIVLGAATKEQLVFKGNAAFYSELSFNKMVYPSTTYGLLAKWKELYKQAQLARSYQTLYTSNKNGLTRPETNRILEAFYPVIDQSTPVFFKTETALDVYRVLALKDELNLKSLMIGGIKQGWDVAERIKSSGIPVFLSLGLDEEKKLCYLDSTLGNIQERKRLMDRQKEYREKQASVPARYDSMGIPFGFTTLDVNSKYLMCNIRKMITAGLSEDAALKALTVTPAKFFGLGDKLGTVEKGKIANLILTDKPVFDEGTAIEYVFVDGNCYKQKKKKQKLENNVSKDIHGSWSMVTETPQGKVDLKVVFVKEDNRKYTGQISGGKLLETTALTSVTQEADTLSFTYSVTFEDGSSVKVTISGKLTGTMFKGNMTVGKYGSFNIEGSKDPEIKR